MLTHPKDRIDHCVACGRREPYCNRASIGNDLILDICGSCLQALVQKGRSWLDAARKAHGLPPLDWTP